jgi:hypothetical protein
MHAGIGGSDQVSKWQQAVCCIADLTPAVHTSPATCLRVALAYCMVASVVENPGGQR